MSPDRRAGDRRRPAWPPGRRGASLPLLVMLLTIGVALSPAQAADASGHPAHQVFSASQHAPGTCAATPDAGAPTWTAQPSATFDAEPIRPLQAFRAHESRAPPVLPSV